MLEWGKYVEKETGRRTGLFHFQVVLSRKLRMKTNRLPAGGAGQEASKALRADRRIAGMTESTPKPQLLAPAGSPEAFFAALENGADAVYCGLQEFSARAKARNIRLSELEGMLACARQQGRKIYVTVNTLVKELELPRLVETLAALEALTVDGVILQDLAVWRLARDHFPGLRLHASTQMTVHNSAGIRMLERMGFSRAVLARELTLDEIAVLRRHTRLELEHFVHGALCFCFSGQCYFSSWLGGRSGNRGRCAQPCRRLYRSRGRDGYYFSPNDLSAIELLPQLAAAGITSFKIEGRMKSAEYVANVVAAYRQVMDAPPSQRDVALSQAREQLKASLGRRPTRGFLGGSQPDDIASPALKGATGRFLGEVQAVRGTRILFQSRDRLHVGDRLRVQPKSDRAGTAFTVRSLMQGKRQVQQVDAGAQVAVDSPFRDTFQVGDGVFKVASGKAFNLSEAACRRRLEQAGKAPLPVSMEVTLSDDLLRVAARCGPWALERSYPVTVHMAQSRPISPATLRGVFERSGGTPFVLQDFQAGELPPVVIPPSRLKEVRRDFYRQLAEQVNDEGQALRDAHRRQALESLQPAGFRPETAEGQLTVAVGQPRDAHILNDKAVDSVQIPLLPAALQGIGRRLRGRETRVIWDLPLIILDQEWDSYREAAAQLVSRGFCRFRLNNLSHFELFEHPAELDLSTGYRLFSLNSQAMTAWRELGVRETVLYLEDDRENLRQLLARQQDDAGDAAVTLYGAVPLITSRIRIGGLRPGSRLESDRGDGYWVEQRSGLTVLRAERDFSLLERLPELQQMGCRRFIIDLSHLGPFSPRGKQVLEAFRRGQGVAGTSPFNYEAGLE